MYSYFKYGWLLLFIHESPLSGSCILMLNGFLWIEAYLTQSRFPKTISKGQEKKILSHAFLKKLYNPIIIGGGGGVK